MLNPLESYQEAGRKAALAQNVGDAATVKHWRSHFHAMRELESARDRDAAVDAFNRAYAAARRGADGQPLVANRVLW